MLHSDKHVPGKSCSVCLLDNVNSWRPYFTHGFLQLLWLGHVSSFPHCWADCSEAGSVTLPSSRTLGVGSSCRAAVVAGRRWVLGLALVCLHPRSSVKAGTALPVPPSPDSKLPWAVMPRWVVVPPDIFGVGSLLSTNSTHFSRMEDNYFCLWFFSCKHCGLLLFSFPTKLWKN